MKKIFQQIGTAMIFLAVTALTVPVSAAPSQEDTKAISAKALGEHECNDDEWHFVITQIDTETHAPGSIYVVWANGNSETVPLDKYTGKTAHYVTTSNLDSKVVSAMTLIYASWDGQFNLSHGPCGSPPPPPPHAQVSVSPGTCQWIEESSVTTVTVTISGEATVTITGPGGPYVFTSSGSVNLGPGDYDWSAVAGEGYVLDEPSSGAFTTVGCKPEVKYAHAEVTVDPGCVKEGETKTVTITVGHAILTINLTDYSVSQTIELPAGSYTWSAVADEGYILDGPSSGTLTIELCTTPPPPPPPPPSGVVILIEECKYQEGVGSLRKVTVIPQNATVHGLPGGDISQLTILWLLPGQYPYTWEGPGGSGEGVINVSADCKPNKQLWKAVCKILPCGAALWENIFGGNPPWYSLDLYGSEDERPVAARILQNCVVVSGGARCDNEWWVVAYARKGDHDFDMVRDGLDFPAPDCHVGADGQCWTLYMNPIGKEDPHKTADQNAYDNRHSGYNSMDGWYLLKDGKRVKSHFYVPCCFAASYAMTSQENGANYAIKFPGMCQWSWVQFFVKTGLYANPGENNWAGWQYLFDQNLSWYEQFKTLSVGGKIAFPDPITEIPAQ